MERSASLVRQTFAVLVLGLAFPASLQADWEGGVAAFKAGRYADAEREFEEVVARQPDWSGGHFMLGQVLLQQRKNAEALRHLKKAYDLKPSDVSYQYALGQGYLQNGLYSDAAQMLRKVNPTSLPKDKQANYQKMLAAALERSGDSAGALTALKGVVEANPEDANAWHAYGTAAFNAGDTATGLTALETAVRLDPSDTAKQEAHSRALAALAEKEEIRRLVDELNRTSTISSLSPPPNGECLKLVFERFCLGAPISTLPEPDSTTDELLTYAASDEVTSVRTVGGHIAAVLRPYRPGSWLAYRRLESTLQTKYSNGEDTSVFPDYADDDDSRATAISLGKARAAQVWRQPGWTIVLQWEGDGAVTLIYYHNVLWGVLQQKRLEQF